jgi:hypothetical protein
MMTGHNLLVPLRRWLIQPGSPQKVITVLLATALIAAAALVALHYEGGAGGSDMSDIEHAGLVAS